MRLTFPMVVSLVLASSGMLSSCSSEIGKAKAEFVDGCSQGNGEAEGVCKCAFDKLEDHYGKEAMIEIAGDNELPSDFLKMTALAAMQCQGKNVSLPPRSPAYSSTQLAAMMSAPVTLVQTTPAAQSPSEPMAQSADECGKPGYNSNNGICHPVRNAVSEPAPPVPPSTVAITAPAQSVAPPVVTPASTNVGNAGEVSPTEVAHTYQPGFDCAKAQSPTELTICADPLLSALDSDVAAQYHALAQQADPSLKGDLLSSQREYLGARNICGSDRACVERQTRSRLHDLRQQAARTPGVLIATLKSDYVSAP